MLARNEIKKTSLKRLINYTWLILAAIFMAFLLNSCTSTKNIRNGKKEFSTKSNKNSNEKLLEKFSQSKNTENITEKEENEEKEIEIPSIKEFADKMASKNFNSSISNVQNITESNGRKIPTLREQMKQLADDQTMIKGQINTLKNDVSEIKESLKYLKNDLIETKAKEKSNQVVFAKASSQEFINSDENENNQTQQIALPKKKELEKKNKTNIKKSLKKVKKPSNQTITKNESKTNNNSNLNIATKKTEIKNDNKADKKEVSNLNNSINNFDLALKAFQSHDYGKAIELFSKNLTTETNSTKVIDTYYWLGESYYGLKKYDQAVENFNKVIKQKSHSKQSNAQILVAECLTKKGDFAEAKKAFQSFISKYPQSDYIPRAKKMLQQL